MSTYKIGNKVDCIINTYQTSTTGKMELQPYTILSDLEGELNFDKYDGTAKTKFLVNSYNIDHVRSLNLNNVLITDKILKLIFDPIREGQLHNYLKTHSSAAKEIFLSLPDREIKDVFIIYNNQIEQKINILNTNIIKVQHADDDYLIIYSYAAKKTLALNKMNTSYVSIDLRITGNEDNNTNTYWIHLDKCALSINKTLFFSSEINTVDLQFKIIDDNDNTKNYITIE